jgi:hypothetical protein
MTDKPRNKNFFLFLFLVVWSSVLFVPTVISAMADDQKIKNTASVISIGLHVFSILFFAIAFTIFSLGELSKCCYRREYQDL